MKKQNRIVPVGPKGEAITERMKELMGIKTINENVSKVVVELTKIGPDGYPYAVIRENHEWFIKKANKTKELVAEDFKYIGGLMNKHSEGYSSYAKAIKHLNLKFKSLAEAYNFDGEINVFENDNLLNEAGAASFANAKSGFSGEGNLEGDEPVTETMDTFANANEGGDEEPEMTEAEKAVDAMLKTEEFQKTEDGVEHEEAKNDWQKTEDGVEHKLSEGKLKIGKLSIGKGLVNMDALIDTLTTPKKKV